MVDEIETTHGFRRGWGRLSCSCSCSGSLTEDALLVTLAVSIAPGTDAAALVAGMTLEVVAAGVGMLRDTPTDLQTSDAKARVTRERGRRCQL